MPILDSLVAAILMPLAIFVLVSGLDDLVLLIVWAARRAAKAGPDEDAIRAIPEKRIAVFVPLWQEHRVIGRMLEHNVAAIRYRNYHIFAGIYPNDPATLAAVRDRHVCLAVCPSDGPTSKGDCLNWIYQQMLIFEEEQGIRFDAVVTHDAEDLIHPDALHWINYHLDRFDMVQVPVLPLPTPWRNLTHGVYCDEFAEYQTKDVPARQAFGSFIPSNGVGTGYSRRALEALAESSSNRVFEPGCLTEDYENGLRLYQLGFRQIFVPLRFTGGQPVATREYFPQGFRPAVRQRTRWIMGIALQTWERHGWRGGPAVRYWFWRDRKGLLGNPVSVLASAVFVYGASTWLWSRLYSVPWQLGKAALHSEFAPVLSVTLALQLAQVLFRTASVARIYGCRFALGVPVRLFWANAINSLATFSAVSRYAQARWSGRPIGWTKTEHNYPSREALAPHKRRLGEVLTGSGYLAREDLKTALASQPVGIRLGEHLVHTGMISASELYEALALQQNVALHEVGRLTLKREAMRTLPARLAERWRTIPVEISGGRLIVAGPEVLTEEIERGIRRHTGLEVHCRLVTPEDFEHLRQELTRHLRVR